MSKLQFGVLAGLLVVLIAVEVAPLVSPQRFAPKYEYRIEDVPDEQFEAQMDLHGNGGWQLVFARRASDQHDKMGYELIFMRPK